MKDGDGGQPDSAKFYQVSIAFQTQRRRAGSSETRLCAFPTFPRFGTPLVNAINASVLCRHDGRHTADDRAQSC